MQRSLLLILVIAFPACQRVVEIESPFPTKVRYCETEEQMLGQWYSDSVWIETTVDTLDSIVVNKSPTMIYLLTASCSEDTAFLVEYFNYAGVLTQEVFSTHFRAVEEGYFVFNALDEGHDTTLAEFRLGTDLTSDTTMTASFAKSLGSGQQSAYTLFLHKVD
jgi:hypothetical protein